MMIVDERLLHNKTIVRIGVEHDIIKRDEESEVEYVMRVIKELEYKPRGI